MAAVAERLGVSHYFASQLGFTEGLCDGGLTSDLEGNKAQIIRREFTTDEVVFITDNFSDANCISEVHEFRPVFAEGDVRASLFWRSKPTAEAILYR